MGAHVRLAGPDYDEHVALHPHQLAQLELRRPEGAAEALLLPPPDARGRARRQPQRRALQQAQHLLVEDFL